MASRRSPPGAGGAEIFAPAFSGGARAELAVAVGKAAKVQVLIDHLETKTDAAGQAAVDNLETEWLKTLDCQADCTTLYP